MSRSNLDSSHTNRNRLVSLRGLPGPCEHRNVCMSLPVLGNAHLPRECRGCNVLNPAGIEKRKKKKTIIFKSPSHSSRKLVKHLVGCCSRRHFGQGGGYMGTGHRFRGKQPPQKRILVTGASGQIGSEFVPYLRQRYGANNVVASDVKTPTLLEPGGLFVYCDVTQFDQIARVALEHQINWIVHLGALLSATGEKNPGLALKINNQGLENVLEVARLNSLSVYVPSSIAAFGPTSPSDDTPNLTIMRPKTIYGITKVYSELLGEYYHAKHGVDFRSIRYPGIISSKTAPGGGTTDYAVEIYLEALLNGEYKCFLGEDTLLPMMYMPDCLRATIDLLEADPSRLTHRVYNVAGMSFTPGDQAVAIREHIPDFKIEYEPDFRQDIAQTWPRTLDDSSARRDWDWQPHFDLESMTEDMLKELKGQLGLA